MITSESAGVEFRRFLFRYEQDLVDRVYGLIMKKYRRTIIPILKKGGDLPTIFGKVKIDDNITLYGQVYHVIFKKESLDFRMECFIIMKALREQTRIMVTLRREGDDYGIVYSTHAISRYKERLGLDPDMDFEDVCKHMFSVGKCGTVGIFNNNNEVYGTNTNNRVANFVCSNGLFMGYYSIEKDMYYAETFLSPKELREDQAHLNPETNPLHIQMRETLKMFEKGTLSDEALEELSTKKSFVVEDENIRFLSRSEALVEEAENLKFLDENPNLFIDQANENRSKAQDRIRRKGYK